MTPPRLHRFGPSQYRVMPWRNGGGSTTELAIEPEGATLGDGFHWRLSMADVGVSGPFSRFEGYDRTLLLLEGNGMRLDILEQEPILMDRLLQPASFLGEWSTAGVLLDGPCRDFNVITRRTRCRHRLAVYPLDAGECLMLEAEVRYAFCARGRARAVGLGLELGPLEMLRIEEPERPLYWSAERGSDTVLIAIGIDRIHAGSPAIRTFSREDGSVLP